MLSSALYTTDPSALLIHKSQHHNLLLQSLPLPEIRTHFCTDFLDTPRIIKKERNSAQRRVQATPGPDLQPMTAQGELSEKCMQN